MKKLTSLTYVLCSIFLFSCEENTQLKEDEKLEDQAYEIAHKYIITDGHVDLPYRLDVRNFKLTKEFIGIPIETDKGDFDFVRAKQGGLDAPFMSIYVPASFQENGGAKMFADSLIDMVQKIIEAHPDNFTKGDSPADCEKAFAEGKIALPMGMENGAPIMDDLANVKHFHDRGIRYITLTHSKVNQICDSSYDTIRTWNGLSPFGVEVVKEMNNVGIMVDISHVSDSTFYQVMNLAKAPCIASHSSVRKFVPGFERNMNDDMIKLLGEKNGVICINFGSTFLDGKLRKKQDEDREKLSAILTEKGLGFRDSLAESIIEQFRKDNPRLFSDVEMVANHIDHVVKIAGIDHVGLGSDFDGVGDSLPVGLKDVSQFPNLVKVLLQRGYSEEDIAKICYKNVFRVWNEVEKVAASI
ncbi:dipeptidase [Saprospiraceae bacterium]|nr:dipeptidase [Saprospiraceae bacterium]MDB4505534.1 dipeptidase [Saprospiraceae bacterium]MDC3219643.1 dipeptidase [Saprospiraceae bacterium]